MELKSKLNFWLLLKKTTFTEQNDALILKQDGANTLHVCTLLFFRWLHASLGK